MPVPVTMPQLGESVTEGTVTRWLKNVGDTVELDEPLLEVSTDKVDTEIPSPIAGTLVEIVVVEDDVVEVGGVLAHVATADEGSSDASQAPAAPAPVSAPATPAPEPELEAAPEVAPDLSEVTPEASTSPAAPEVNSGSTESTDVTLPALGESVTEGIVTRWLKNVGDVVDVDEPLLEISTDKVDTEIPSPVAGILNAILAQEDETVAVGAVLATISSESSSSAPAASAPAAPTQATQPATDNVAVAPEPASQASTPNSAKPPTASPIVRKLARENQVDLASIVGSGPDGKVRKDDILAATSDTKPTAAESRPAVSSEPQAGVSSTPPAAPNAASPDLRPGQTSVVAMTRLRKVIADRMVESLQVSAQLTTVVEIDLTHVASLRQRAKESFKQREGVSLTFMPFFARATVEALREFPQVNASIDMEQSTVLYHGEQHLGFAVDTPRGLLVPVVRNAGDLTLAGLARRISELAQRTRDGSVGPDDLFGGTFTLTNTGSRGALFDTPIINQPQVGILGTGTVVKRPVVITDDNGEDSIAIRSMAYFSLTYDHRIVDGADAARFLGFIKERLEAANFESELGLT